MVLISKGRLFAGLVAAFLSVLAVSGSGSGATPLLVSTPIATSVPTTIDVLPGARIFILKTHGNRIVGADVGPSDGEPVMVVPGFAADFPYLSPFVNQLVKRGCRVFIYNPQGQGGHALKSSGTDATLGMTGLVQTVLDIHAYIRQLTGNRPVTWTGHSMGGMEIRMASLFVPKAEIRALVPMFSPSIKYAKADPMNPILEYERLLNEQIFSDDLINAWTLGVYDWWRLESAKMMFVSSANGVLKGLLGCPHPNDDDLRANAAYFVDWKASPEIIADVERAVFTGGDKSDLVKDWTARDLSDVTVLSFTGTDDGVISSDGVVMEAKDMGYPNIQMPVGHVGAYYDTSLTSELSDLVARIARGEITKSNLNAQTAALESK